ncbi:MAG: aldose 1-epimerase [Planctomycetaceae bacterium]
MPSITIVDAVTGASATIAPERGFNCFSFQAPVHGETVEALDVAPGFLEGTSRPTRTGIPILFPFPNRIRRGQFVWENREFVIPGTDDWGNAIHGFCADRAWRVIDHGPSYVVGQFQLSVDAPDRISQWPADFRLEVEYRILRQRLRATFRIQNPTDRALPWGLGTHPYFRAPLGAGGAWDDCTLEVPAHSRWDLVDCLPTGTRTPVPPEFDLRDGAGLKGLKLDDVFGDLECTGPQFDCTLFDERAGIQLTQTCPPIFREAVVFTPPERSCICVEPYTCVTDAVNLQAQGIDAGLRVLAPGAEFRTWIDLTLGPVLA